MNDPPRPHVEPLLIHFGMLLPVSEIAHNRQLAVLRALGSRENAYGVVSLFNDSAFTEFFILFRFGTENVHLALFFVHTAQVNRNIMPYFS